MLIRTKLETHRQAGRRVVFADAEDPGFWNNLRFGRLEAVVLTMPEPESQCWATNRLRERGFEGVIAVSTHSHHAIARVEGRVRISFTMLTTLRVLALGELFISVLVANDQEISGLVDQRCKIIGPVFVYGCILPMSFLCAA